ncbi:hypothetical protein KFL_002700050 [Klebsormidium nitens]|uniref:Uncharacterized protein n=1 Tax=Klebsormidium nitens TaxID=105231 RepID=A0A1Y1IBK0_KLENI|nr:hypothetical protein KFL_002700050 [Klebsormidium nitens]|eukprot:GAQ86086.1 hypothetical protein KFL_002700050 [Klebsormidium nitens]
MSSAGQQVQASVQGSASIGAQPQGYALQQQPAGIASLDQQVRPEQHRLAQPSADARPVPAGTPLSTPEGERVPVATSVLPAAAAPLADGNEVPASGVFQEGGHTMFQDHPLQSDVETVQEPIIVSVGDHRVRLSSEADPSSLYSLCRKWVRNRPTDDEELGYAPVVPSVLPRPLPLEPLSRETDANGGQEERGFSLEDTISGRLTPRDLLRTHVRNFREIRKKKREEWQQRVKRYKPRLCLIFPPGAAAVTEKKDVSKGEAKR